MVSVQQLYIYPVKSLGGISVQSANLTDRGLEHDRRFMLINEANRFLSQRTVPQMALLKVMFGNNGFIVENQLSGESFSFSPPGENMKFTKAMVWDDDVEAQLVSQQADDWFTRQLNVKCRLVYMPEASKRNVPDEHARQDEYVSFADDFPLLMISQASLDDLNNRLLVPMNMDRFRPNVVISGCAPYDEDNYARFDIGKLQARGVKPCARCAVTTINQQTGHKGVEPLATLATYRKADKKVYFGQNLLIQNHGSIHVGDQFTIHELALPKF